MREREERKRRWIYLMAVLLVGALLFGSVPAGVRAADATTGAEDLSPDVDTVIDKVSAYILAKDTNPDYSSIWNVIGLKRSGVSVPQSYIDTFYSNVIAYCEEADWQITKAKYSDYSKLIIALTAIGVDAQDVKGHNLFYYLSDYKNVSRQGNNGPIWALIALKCNPNYSIPENASASEQVTEALLIKKILNMQCTDGGWALVGTEGDSDMTGMAMQALCSYYGQRSDVTAALDRGMEWISQNQLKSGGFGTMNTETSESVAQIITALCGIGVDCKKDSRFVKAGKWPMTGLFQYYMSEGGFMHVAADAANNGGGTGGIIDGMATEQGFYATVAYRRLLNSDTFLYDMSDVTISSGEEPTATTAKKSETTTAKKSETTTTAPKSKVKVIKVGLNYSKIYLTVGKSKSLVATVTPTNASNKKVKWTSSNKKVATVNSKGKVTAKKAGTVEITAKAKDGSGKKASCTVVVSSAAAATTATTATTATKRVTATTAARGQTRRSISAGTTAAARGTTKSVGSTQSGTTAKKKSTSSEATTASGWSFSGEDYVPESGSSDSEDEESALGLAASEKPSAFSRMSKFFKSVAKDPQTLLLAVLVLILALFQIELLAFILYKFRHPIGGAFRRIFKIFKRGDKE